MLGVFRNHSFGVSVQMLSGPVPKPKMSTVYRPNDREALSKMARHQVQKWTRFTTVAVFRHFGLQAVETEVPLSETVGVDSLHSF